VSGVEPPCGGGPRRAFCWREVATTDRQCAVIGAMLESRPTCHIHRLATAATLRSRIYWPPDFDEFTDFACRLLLPVYNEGHLSN
jgi:hypothetical protein